MEDVCADASLVRRRGGRLLKRSLLVFGQQYACHVTRGTRAYDPMGNLSSHRISINPSVACRSRHDERLSLGKDPVRIRPFPPLHTCTDFDMPFRRRASSTPSVISVSPSPGAKHGRGVNEDVGLCARPVQRDTSDAWRQERFSTPYQTGRVRPEDQAGIVLPVSDATIFLAILFGASVSNLAVSLTWTVRLQLNADSSHSYSDSLALLCAVRFLR